jgi:glycosyltransferase involved in cell wall biosynthesis
MRLLLIGAGRGLLEAQELTVELSLAGDVVFAGHLSDQAYAPLLAQADIGLAPYCNWPEYSGLKILDYKAAGLASIVSGRDGQPATIDHGRTGWIVPPCDEDALADAMFRLVTDPALRREMGQTARLDAEALHSWAHTVGRIEQLLTQTLVAASRVAPRSSARIR